MGGALLSAQPDLTDWRIEKHTESHSVVANAEIRVVNPWGDVRLRTGEGEEVVVSALAQRHRADPRAPDIHVEETPGGLSIEVRFPDSLEVAETPEWERHRVDLGLFVPAGATVSIRTEDGEIEVEGLEGRADLATRGGAISFRGGGGLAAHSESGSIFAQFRLSGWPFPAEVETRTGDIRAEFLEGAAATVEIETRGWITSDYSTLIERAVGSRAKRGVATVGAGGQTLRLSSYSGGIKLLAVIVPEGASEPRD
jgi:hypothetical protein